MTPLPRADLQHILTHMGKRWGLLRGRDMLITGGTGFFGKWLLESFVAADEEHKLDGRAWVVSRDPDAFLQRMPHLREKRCLEFIAGDVQAFKVPKSLRFSHVIHAATQASVMLNQEAPLSMLDTIVNGTRHVLDVAQSRGAGPILLTSSGAVYGPQPSDISHVPETYGGAPDCTQALSAYGEGKRLAETLCAAYARTYNLSCKVARCFAFVGPHLPLDGAFAAGNFLRDALAQGPVRVTGDGAPKRSYLHAADLTIWLWRILFEGKPMTAYNVGSEDVVTIGEMAHRIAKAFGCEVTVAKAAPPTAGPVPSYVPSTARARQSLQLATWISLDEAIQRTKDYLQ